MDDLSYWRLAEELTVYQIALLGAGYDPADFATIRYDQWDTTALRDTNALIAAIQSAAYKGSIDCELVRNDGYGADEFDWLQTKINVASFQKWLATRPVSLAFFNDDMHGESRIADPQGPFYAPKLAAAVRAWAEVTADPKLHNGKRPKSALEAWLRDHAAEYDLLNKDGTVNATGIEEITKIANWKPKGGATPTPSVAEPTPPFNHTRGRVTPNPTPPSRNRPPPFPQDDLDDDIPF